MADANGAGAALRVELTSTRRSLAFVYVGYAFRYLQLLILVPFYGRVLGAAEYGRVLAAMSLFQVVWMLTEYSLPTVGARDIARATDGKQLAELYGRHVMGRLAMCAPGIALGLAGTMLSPVLRERPLFGVLATLNGIVMAFSLGWYFQGALRFRTSVLLEVLSFALSLPPILLLVRNRDDGAIVLGSLLAASVIATSIGHGLALASLDRTAIRWRGGITLLRDSMALFVHKGLSVMMSGSSTYLISVFASAAHVGWYGAAERMVNAALGLLLPAHQVLMRTVSFRISARESEDAAFALMRKALLALTAFGALMMVGSLLLAERLVPLILGPEFGPSVPLLKVLGLMLPFAAFCQVIMGYVLIPLCFDSVVAKVSLFCAVATVLSILALGHVYGSVGVAWARSLGYVLMTVVLIAVLRRKQLVGRVFSLR